MLENDLPASCASRICSFAIIALNVSQSLQQRQSKLQNRPTLAPNIRHLLERSKPAKPQEPVQVRTLPSWTRQLPTDSESAKSATYSVLVIGVPVRHQRYLDRSIATALLQRVPRFRTNCASSRMTRYHRICDNRPLWTTSARA